MHKVQVFKSWLGFLSLLLGCSAFICGALQVELQVHAEDSWQDVVHYDDPDVLPSGLYAVQAEEFWKESPRVLVQILKWRQGGGFIHSAEAPVYQGHTNLS